MKITSRRLIPTAGVAVAAALMLVGYQESRADDGAAGKAAASAVAANAPVVTLYKNPTCQCCAGWAEHMEENGFRVDVVEGADLAKIRAEYGISDVLASCHSAVVGGYALEGHVPADVVQQLLRERPAVRALAVAGMPPGVPGMPAVSNNRSKFPVVAVQQDGSASLYAER